MTRPNLEAIADCSDLPTYETLDGCRDHVKELLAYIAQLERYVCHRRRELRANAGDHQGTAG